jgi:hypothetical protein
LCSAVYRDDTPGTETGYRKHTALGDIPKDEPERKPNDMNRADEVLRVSTSDGKYTVVQFQTGRVDVLRYGEPWKPEVHENVLLAFAYDLELARLTDPSRDPNVT